MQTIYAYSYNPAIATGTNTTNTVWRMAYQQPIQLYKGTANTIKIVVFNNNQKVVDLTEWDVQVQIVDRETEEHFVTRTATNTDPETGVVSVTFTEADLRNLQHRFYHIIARLMPIGDGSTVIDGEILYLDDNYGAFTPVTIEDAWNYRAADTAVTDGVSNIDLSAVGNVIPSITNTYYLGNTSNRWHSLFTGNATLGNLSISGANIQTTGETFRIKVDSQILSVTDNSTDPNHLAGDGGFIAFNDSTHTNDGPQLEIWYGNVAEPADPPGQHSLDIRAAANSYVEFASNDLTMFMGVDNVSPFVQTNFDIYPDRFWRFMPDGELQLPFDGSKITSHGGQISVLMNFSDLRFLIRDSDGSTVHSTIFDTTGDVYFEGDLLPGGFSPDPTPQHSLGSPTHPWKDLHVSNSTIYVGGVPISVDAGGNLLVDGSPVTGGGGGTIQPYLELTNDPIIFTPYVGNVVTFTKADYATGAQARDEIDTGLAIARNNNQGIYNPYLEPDWDNTSSDGPSPAGTLWNKDGWTNLTNLNQRIYFSFYDTFLRFGNNVLAAEAVMYDTANNKYYKFDFTTWGNANQGAPLAYTRTQLDPVTGDPIGDPVTFTKAGYADPTQVNDPIDTNLTIARGNNQSIYNIALETGYSSIGDGEDSPEGTEWNAEGWTNLRQVATRSYDTFLEVMNNQIGNNIVNKELVMHDMINDKYYAVKFSSWTQNNAGGGFSYTRQLINTTQYFSKTDYGNEVDIFIADDGNGAGVGITRDNNNGIYNPYREEGWNSNVSPAGTLWNIDGWNDLSNIETRTYQTFYDAFGQGGLGYKVPGTECVMYLPDNGKYYLIKFRNWTQGGNGGGFSYERYELDLTKINEGIKFADGTILKSANGIGRVKSTASRGRRIDEVAGSNTVSVTPITTVNLTTTASRAGSNTQTIWIDSTASQIDEVLNNPGTYDINDYTTLQFSLDNATWYTWGQSTSFSGNERGYSIYPATVSYNQGDTVYFRYNRGGAPQVWWDKNELPGGSADFRGAIIDYHAYTGQATFIGTIHIVSDSGDENIAHTEVSSGSSDSENDDLWLVQNEGTISYRRMDGEAKTLKVHWTAKVFYGQEFYD